MATAAPPLAPDERPSDGKAASCGYGYGVILMVAFGTLPVILLG
eukprot:COSAG02_NODE_36026_length_460_cov_0.576177_1_plen_43_part_01